ncbi:hypothetical protein F4778DRAFT_716006 [Xylariomycetidae sp. FL2044]|nr:hypothetical protein F4778DRAFT_716006 [Xylariomycetidae sp. FL2044]
MPTVANGHFRHDSSRVQQANNDQSDTSHRVPSEAKASTDDGASTTSSSSHQQPEELVGADDDSLIPTTADINRVFHQGRKTWTQFVELAKSLPGDSMPPGLNNPAIMLKDVPALPRNIPKRGVLVGQPLWHVPDENDLYNGTPDQDWDLKHLYGTQRFFNLSCSSPIECRSSSEGASHHGVSPDADRQRNSTAPRGLLLLTLCWSYILSVRFWELQGKTAIYTENVLQPNVTTGSRASRNNIQLNLKAPVSQGLVKWLCAILAPKPGWSAKGGDFAPWTAFCSGDTQISLHTDMPMTSSSDGRPPNSAEAAEFLVEICTIYGLDSSKNMGSSSDPLSPVTAAFLAALALPFYCQHSLQPQFPHPVLRRRPKSNQVEPGPIRQLISDLPYYMTLSMDRISVGSIIWSIFWEPEVQCNLVSPWLGSILSVLQPIIRAGRLDIVVKAFSFRRPRVALWWLGVFLLGNPAISDFIVRYLETTEERYGYGSMARPDPTVSAWTGSPQSFLDQGMSRVYSDPKDLVPRAELLRHRYNFRLQNAYSVLLSWTPFGFIPKEAIEVDLWPWVEHQYAREYMHWVWWIKTNKGLTQHIQRGFRNDTGRFVPDVPDRLGMVHLDHVAACDDSLNLEPSRAATVRMVSHCMEDMSGDRDAEIMAMPGVHRHPWLANSRVFE